MEDNVAKAAIRTCPQDCKKCSMAQQVFCSAQMSFTSFEIMNSIIESINSLKNDIRELKCSQGELNDPIISGRNEVFEIDTSE